MLLTLDVGVEPTLEVGPALELVVPDVVLVPDVVVVPDGLVVLDVTLVPVVVLVLEVALVPDVGALPDGDDELDEDDESDEEGAALAGAPMVRAVPPMAASPNWRCSSHPRHRLGYPERLRDRGDLAGLDYDDARQVAATIVSVLMFPGGANPGDIFRRNPNTQPDLRHSANALRHKVANAACGSDLVRTCHDRAAVSNAFAAAAAPLPPDSGPV